MLVFFTQVRLYFYFYFRLFFRINHVFGRSRWPRGLRRRSAAARLLVCWFESHRGHGRFSVVSVVCCQVEVSATSWSLVQRSPTDCGASLCVIKKPREWGRPGPLEAVAPITNKQTNKQTMFLRNRPATWCRLRRLSGSNFICLRWVLSVTAIGSDR